MSRATFVVLALVFLGSGLALLAAAARQLARRRAFVAGSATALGRVVGFEERRDEDLPSSFARVTFRTPVGHEISFVSEVGSERPAERIGDVLRVRYRIDSPNEAEIDAFFALWGLALSFGALGVVFVSVGFGMLTGCIPA
jgi:hypothetical protein